MDRFMEYGRIGQKRSGGFFNEEFLRELRGRKGVAVYTEMINNDDVIGPVSTAIELLCRQVSWDVEPDGEKNAADQKAADFIKECLDDMQKTWTDTISEILTFLDYGWAYHEIVYKYRRGDMIDKRFRSKYSDGLIGWRKLPIRAQDTLFEWQVSEDDDLLGMTQQAPPSYGLFTVPIDKAIHFRTTSVKDNPEGRSMWRRAYRPWYFKKRIQEIEGIGIERDLAGFPTIQPPIDGPDIFDENDPEMVKQYNRALAMVTNIRQDKLAGAVIPPGWVLTLLSTGGKRQFDTTAIIERYDTRIAMVGLADFILLGHQKVGSYALSNDKTNMFNIAMNAFLGIICEAFNAQAIPRLMQLNASSFSGMSQYPKLVHGKVNAPNLKDIGTFIKDMTGCGVLIPGPELEQYVRRTAELPEEAETLEMEQRRDSKLSVEGADEEDLIDEQTATQAKKSLGRE